MLKSSSLYCIIIILINVFFYFITTSYVGEMSSDSAFISCSIVSFFAITLEFYILKSYIGSLFVPYSLLLFSFVLFHFGIFWLYGFGLDYNYFYLNKFSSKELISGAIFEFLCTGALFLAAGFQKIIKPVAFSNINRLQIYRVYKIAKTGLMITSVVAFSLLLIKMSIFVSGLYEGVRQFESRVPTIISIFEYFFPPFLILTFLYSKHKSPHLIRLLIFWSIITALLGDRTSGIGGIVVALLLDSKYSNNFISKKKRIYILLGFLLVIFLIPMAGAFREGNQMGSTNLFFAFVSVIGELGGSFFPLLLIMQICPSVHPFLMGNSYLYSILVGFIPESLDPTGFVHQGLKEVIEPVYWIENDFDFTFGTGYSLCAEAYANFGNYGFVCLFFIGLVLVKLLKGNVNNRYSTYVSLVMLFELFTLPRRNMYYILSHSFYCIIFMTVLLIWVNKKRNV